MKIGKSPKKPIKDMKLTILDVIGAWEGMGKKLTPKNMSDIHALIQRRKAVKDYQQGNTYTD